MIARTHVCGGSSPRLVSASSVAAVVTTLTNAGDKVPHLRLVEGGFGSPAPTYWEEAAKDPALVCWELPGGGTEIAFVGEEPKSGAEWRGDRRGLGHSGRGFVVVGLDGEGTITHNLQSRQPVPVGLEHLFAANIEGVRSLSLVESNRHWDAVDRAEGVA